MTLTAWRTYVEVCQLGSLSAAAGSLGYTQSAVSRQVAALEREVGVRLLVRAARGVTPTAAGEAFRQHAVTVVDGARRAVDAARTAGDGTSERELVVGATPSLAASAVPAAVRRLLDGGRAMPWRLVPGLTAHLHERLLAGELDVAVVTDAPPGLPDDDRVVRRTLGVDEMIVVVPRGHPVAALSTVDIATLADELWAEDNAGSAALLRQHAARAGFAPRIDLSAADLPAKLALVATGHAIALAPGSLSAALRPDLAAVRLTGAPTRGIYALTPRRGRHPAAAALVAELASAFADPPTPPAQRAGVVAGGDRDAGENGPVGSSPSEDPTRSQGDYDAMNVKRPAGTVKTV
jgi:DNA-binding transcriptional LysR family regulator